MWCSPPRCIFPWARWRNRGGNSRRWILQGGRGEPEAAADRLDRRSARSTVPSALDRHRGNALGAERSRTAGSRSAHSAARPYPRPRRSSRRIMSPSAVASGACRIEQPRYSVLARGIESSLARRSAQSPWAWECWPGATLALGRSCCRSCTARVPVAVDLSEPARHLDRAPARFDPSIPANVTKLEIVEQLVELADSIGCTLHELAVAFAVAHPGVTSAIIGPRTMEHLDVHSRARRSPWTTRPRPDRRDRAAGDQRVPARRCLAPAGAGRPGPPPTPTVRPRRSLTLHFGRPGIRSSSRCLGRSDRRMLSRRSDRPRPEPYDPIRLPGPAAMTRVGAVRADLGYRAPAAARLPSRPPSRGWPPPGRRGSSI